jgi:LacI family transcriptional regulator
LNKRPIRTDVAKYAGVSVATVSYVVNNGPRSVSDETRQRVLDAINELGYRPHAIARSLKTGSTKTVGLLVQSLMPSFITHLVTAVENSLARSGYGLILASTHEDCDRERNMLQVLADQSIDGLLYIPTTCGNGDIVLQLIHQNIPVVFMDRYIPGIPADVVMTDNICGTKKLVEYLIHKGRHKIVCLTFSTEASSAVDRIEGYCQALIEHGLPYEQHNVLVVRYAEGESVEPALLDYIASYGLPDGIICTTDTFTIETLRTLKRIGLKVPEQVYVAGGFVQADWNALLDHPIPIVYQNFQQIAERAVEFLLERMEGNEYPPRVELVQAGYDFESSEA